MPATLIKNAQIVNEGLLSKPIYALSAKESKELNGIFPPSRLTPS